MTSTAKAQRLVARAGDGLQTAHLDLQPDVKKLQKSAQDLQGTIEITRPEPPLTLCKKMKLKMFMGFDLHECAAQRITRAHVADRLSELLQRKITLSTINGWVAESREDVALPMGWIPAWCEATRSTRLLAQITRCVHEHVPQAVFYLSEARNQQDAAAERVKALEGQVYGDGAA